MVSMFGIRSTKLLLNHAIEPGILVIDRGVVQTVLPYHSKAIEHIEDVQDCVVMAGLVDPHVHLNDPGNTDWEGFETGTRAAAAGGVTTLVDMPLNSLPVTTTPEALDLKWAAAEGKLFVDVSFWGGVVPEDLEMLPRLAARGVPGFKTFMIDSGLPEFAASDEDTLRKAMGMLHDLDLPLLAHAELDLGTPVSGDPKDYATFMHSRPPEWEEAAIRLLIDLCRETGCAVHIVHLAAAQCVPMLAAAKAAGLPITVETCPQYLVFDDTMIGYGRAEFKCCPPIRDKSNQDGLWQALKDGVIDFIATDHSPSTPANKNKGDGDFFQAWGGIASLQLALPVIWKEASKRGFGLEDVSRWLSQAPARLCGLHHRKGQLNPGFDADIVVFEPDVSWTINPEDLYMRHPFTPYAQMTVKGKVVATYLRGERIYTDAAPFQHGPTGQVLLGRITP